MRGAGKIEVESGRDIFAVYPCTCGMIVVMGSMCRVLACVKVSVVAEPTINTGHDQTQHSWRNQHNTDTSWIPPAGAPLFSVGLFYDDGSSDEVVQAPLLAVNQRPQVVDEQNHLRQRAHGRHAVR